MPEEQNRVAGNLRTIREYLTKEFPNFVMTEDTSNPIILDRFTMTDSKTFEQFRLKVGWPRLSDKSKNPENIERALVHGDVARCVNTKGGTSIGEASGHSCVKPPSHAIVYCLAP
jgi:hypothetical protein